MLEHGHSVRRPFVAEGIRSPYGVADEIIDNACRSQSRWWLGWSLGMAEVMAGGVAHGHES